MNIAGRFLERVLRTARIGYEADSFWGRGFKTLLETPAYRAFSLFLIRLMSNNLWKPLSIAIETTGFCNASCVMCPYPTTKRPKGIMKTAVFNRVVNRLVEEKIPVVAIFLNGMGDPLTDPDIFERIKILRSHKFFVRFSTNGALLDEDKARRLIKSGVNEINISFNGADKETYEKVMKLNFDLTMRNIKNLLRLKKELSSPYPVVRISSVLLEANADQVKRHLAYWRPLVESVSVVQSHEWGGDVIVNSPHKAKKMEKIWPCRSLWKHIYISYTGQVYLCCVDYDGKFVIGDINKQTFREIWTGPKISAIRQAHLGGNAHALPKICQNCNVPFRHGLEWFLPRSLI